MTSDPWHVLHIPDSEVRAYIQKGSGASMEIAMRDGRRYTVAEIVGYPRVTRHRDDCSAFHPGRTCDGSWYTGAIREDS